MLSKLQWNVSWCPYQIKPHRMVTSHTCIYKQGLMCRRYKLGCAIPGVCMAGSGGFWARVSLACHYSAMPSGRFHNWIYSARLADSCRVMSTEWCLVALVWDCCNVLTSQFTWMQWLFGHGPVTAFSVGTSKTAHRCYILAHLRRRRPHWYYTSTWAFLMY